MGLGKVEVLDGGEDGWYYSWTAALPQTGPFSRNKFTPAADRVRDDGVVSGEMVPGYAKGSKLRQEHSLIGAEAREESSAREEGLVSRAHASYK